MKIKIEPKKVLPKFDVLEWRHRFDGMYLKSMKPMMINQPSNIIFYVFRLLMLVLFWYASIYIFSQRTLLEKLVNHNLILFLAIYMSVMFNSIYQTLDCVQKFIKDMSLYKSYKETEKIYLQNEAKYFKKKK